jgi:hypothetical protein
MNHFTKYHSALGGDRDEDLVDQQRLLAVAEDGVDVELCILVAFMWRRRG